MVLGSVDVQKSLKQINSNSFPSSFRESIQLPHNFWMMEISFPRLRFVTATGHLLLDTKQSLADIGLKDGDCLGAVVPEALAEGFILLLTLRVCLAIFYRIHFRAKTI